MIYPIVPVSGILPVWLTGTCRHDREATTAVYSSLLCYTTVVRGAAYVMVAVFYLYDTMVVGAGCVRWLNDGC